MATPLRLEVIIPANHRLELALPSNMPAGPAEVTVRPLSVAATPQGPRGRGMDEGKGWVADDFNAPLPSDLQLLFEGQG